VRNANGDIIQLLYGEDGFDPARRVEIDLPLLHHHGSIPTKWSTCTPEIQVWQSLLQECQIFMAESSISPSMMVDPSYIFHQFQGVSSAERNHNEAFLQLHQFITTTFSSDAPIFRLHLYFHLRSQLLCQIDDLETDQMFTVVSQHYEKSKISAGEAVGSNCGSACSAPATQLILNTFHLAGTGSKVNSGLGRLSELYNNRNPKIVNMSLYPKTPETDLKKVEKALQSVHLGQLIRSCCVKYWQTDGVHTDWENTWNKVFGGTPLGAIKEQIVKDSAIYLELQYSREEMVHWNVNMTMIRHAIEETYPFLTVVNSPHYHSTPTSFVYIRPDRHQETKVKKNRKEMDIASFLVTHGLKMWEAVLLRGIQEIEEVNIVNENHLQTTGHNISEITKMEEFDETKLRINQIRLTANTFGIEAARMVLQEQISEVLKDAGTVDQRHILLLVDNMTYLGYVTGNTRQTMTKSKNGFIEKACFESPDTFFTQAATTGQTDDLKGVSACVAVGKRFQMGKLLTYILVNR